MTWMFMYGGIPALQGPIATAMGGVDCSWLAGTVTSSVLYFALGYPALPQAHQGRCAHGRPPRPAEEAVLAEHGDACEEGPRSRTPASGTPR